ncbi:anti-sigma B factor RsbW [Paenibacillus koleovorans]|uniref:anti-sigma B factor RsbW n=1 Tax=Paenibacillus koleovorans TaxID=121608 RepID=UPI000FD94D70|nr:anti-sigma B factor RsbW [Paenibacillus koleovorans]
MSSVRLVIPAAAEYMDLVRLCLYGMASKAGFSYEDIEDMKVAVGEACNNAVLHAYPHDGDSEPATIELSFEQEVSRFIVKVKDRGMSFNHARALEEATPIQAEEPSELQAGGLGLYLMQALMDEVHIRTDDGTEVTLTKYK